MPPRYAYWTILIDQKPTAFRAREREELLPTLHQLRRKNTDVALKWFARGQLWESPEDALAAQRAPRPPVERRGRDWRPGGAHSDPRDRFKKGAKPGANKTRTSGARPEGARPERARPQGARPESAMPEAARPLPRHERDQRAPKGFAPRGKNTGHRAPFTPHNKTNADRKSFAPRPPGGPRKPWQRDRPAPRRPPEAPRTGKPQSSSAPDAAAAKRKLPESE